jgi:hypothetical protein
MATAGEAHPAGSPRAPAGHVLPLTPGGPAAWPARTTVTLLDLREALATQVDPAVDRC